MASDDRLRAVASFARMLVHHRDITDVLHHLAAHVASTLGATAAAVSLHHRGHVQFAIALDEAATLAEQAQVERQAGPGVEAVRTGTSVHLASVADPDPRWPAFAAAVRRAGFVTVLSLPLLLGERSIGALSLYHSASLRWTDDDMAVAACLADIATSHVVTAWEERRHARTAEQLQRALNSRVTIEQAKGVIAAHRLVTVEEAFELLRRHARSHHATVRAVAEAVVHLGFRL